jgi:hypothetical protein
VTAPAWATGVVVALRRDMTPLEQAAESFRPARTSRRSHGGCTGLFLRRLVDGLGPGSKLAELAAVLTSRQLRERDPTQDRPCLLPCPPITVGTFLTSRCVRQLRHFARPPRRAAAGIVAARGSTRPSATDAPAMCSWSRGWTGWPVCEAPGRHRRPTTGGRRSSHFRRAQPAEQPRVFSISTVGRRPTVRCQGGVFR